MQKTEEHEIDSYTGVNTTQTLEESTVTPPAFSAPGQLDEQTFDKSAFTVPEIKAPEIQNNKTRNRIESDGIDDSLVIDFSLDKFNSIHFTIKKNIELFFQDTFPYFLQSLLVPVFHIVYRIFFRLEINGKENLRHKRGPLLFIANHTAFYDSFIFDLFIKPFSHILPFRFMGTRVFSVPTLALLKKIGLIDIVYLLFGVFKVTPGEGAEKSLKKAYEIIKHGGTVAMYPEGRIWKQSATRPDPIGPFKWGAAILAKNTNVQIIPVSFKKIKEKGKIRPKLRINIGKSFFADTDKKPEEVAENMRDIVVGLYNS